ncbi:MAG: MBL fold metallo-hydrolase [bacterium]|nr:MAG: MBL fold metallo-hydrolase [bacterium]
MKKCMSCVVLAVVFLMTISFSLLSQDAEKQIVFLNNIRGSVYQVENAAGGNIALYLGKEDILMVDTGTDPDDAPKIEAALAGLTDKPVKMVVNTHWHRDHVSGNVFWAGKGATIIGHEKLTGRLSKKIKMDFFGRESEPLPKAGWPTVPFEKEKIIDTGEGKIRLFHVQAGHTDGDCIVHFQKENVIHVGDLYFNGLYPYIGVSSGGSIGGMISALTHVMKLIDDDTIVIPGHGPLSNKAGLKKYVDMLSTIQNRVSKLLREGKTLEEIQAVKPTKEYDADWGVAWMNGDEFTHLVVMSLSGN